jgi:hypothetical protein
MLSKKFAYLPNGIIREIISYTGATYKRRNGKYIGQIPKNDPRYAIIKKIPKMEIEGSSTIISGEGEPNSEMFCYRVNLSQNRIDYIHVCLELVIIRIINRTGGFSENDFTYSFHITSFNPDPIVTFSREYTFRQGDVVEKIKNYEISGHPPSIFPTEKSREDLGNSLLAKPATNFLQCIRYLLEIIWLTFSSACIYFYKYNQTHQKGYLL